MIVKAATTPPVVLAEAWAARWPTFVEMMNRQAQAWA